MRATKDQIKKLREETLKLMRQRGVQTLRAAEEGNSYPTRRHTGDTTPYFTGYDNRRLFGWDQYFEGILQLHFEWEPKYVRNSLRLFLQSMEHNGYIPRTLPRIWWGEFHAQPFLAQQAALLLHHGYHPISENGAHLFYNMKRYLLFWLDDMDLRGEGLSVWDHAGHTGMDNHYERAGYFHDSFCEGVDLNSYLVRECLAFAQLAEFLGKDYAAEAAPFRHRAAQRRDAINRWCWNEREGIYYDYHAREDRQIAVKHVGIFTTLWAQVANEQQAERLVQEHLLNPEEFARPWPIPALAATEPGYVAGYLPEEERGCCSWRAHTWIPTNYVTFQGLRRYGYIDEALDLAERSRELYFREPFREYYLSDTGNGCGRSPFWGWSGLALFMEEELECGVDATELRNSSHITGSTQC